MGKSGNKGVDSLRIGILGGSFNPIHRGHIKLAKTALKNLRLNKIIFVPTYQTPLKAKGVLLDDTLRMRVLQKALKPYPYFSISDCEMKRGGVSFTVDTLKFFRKKFGSKARLFFITGADASETIVKWRAWKEIMRLCSFIVASRPGFEAKSLHPGMMCMTMDALAVSSSDIRERLAQRKTIAHLVPRGTAALLKKDFYARKERKNK